MEPNKIDKSSSPPTNQVIIHNKDESNLVAPSSPITSHSQTNSNVSIVDIVIPSNDTSISGYSNSDSGNLSENWDKLYKISKNIHIHSEIMENKQFNFKQKINAVFDKYNKFVT